MTKFFTGVFKGGHCKCNFRTLIPCAWWPGFVFNVGLDNFCSFWNYLNEGVPVRTDWQEKPVDM
jgi:hypothetical protein